MDGRGNNEVRITVARWFKRETSYRYFAVYWPAEGGCRALGSPAYEGWSYYIENGQDRPASDDPGPPGAGEDN
jgi:hypothetical protein